MLGTYFYNKSIRRMTAVFGTLFNNISIKRFDNVGTVIRTIPVSLDYAGAHKYLRRLNQDQKDDEISRVASLLPRMSYRLIGMSFDPVRQQSSIGRHYTVDNNDPDSLNYTFHPTAYNFDYELILAVKHTDDGMQVLEQILPYFNPEFQVTIFEGPDNNIKRNIPIIFQGMAMEDTFEGSFLDRRIITYNMSFMMKGYIYTNKQSSKIIKEVDINTFLNEQLSGDPLVNYDVKPDPQTADADDNFGYTETITENNEG